jgi:hypothetical protein
MSIHRTAAGVVVVVVVAVLAVGGCAGSGTADHAGESPPASASPTPGDAIGSRSSAASDAVAAFVTAAQSLDTEIAETGVLVNGLFVPDGVRYVDAVTVATQETMDRVGSAAVLIPAGLDEKVRVAALQVYQDLFHRAYTLAYVPFYVANGLHAIEHPGEVWAPAGAEQELADQARSLLAFGGMSKARFAEDLASLQELAAASGEPARPVPPQSEAAGLLAFEIASLEIGIQGCHPPPDAPTTVTSLLTEWQSVEVGPIETGSTSVQAYYDPLEGWQIRFPYC